MGYSTDFSGHIQIVPPLNAAEIDYLQKFSDSRRVTRSEGAYFVPDSESERLNPNRLGVTDYNSQPDGQPSLWCQFLPDDSGESLEWDGGEKTYEAVEWVRYLIDHFLKEGAIASSSDDEQFEEFTFNHVLNGELEAQGEESGDLWLLKVVNNRVTRHESIITY